MQNSGAKLVLYYIYILYCRLYKAHNQTIIDLLNLWNTVRLQRPCHLQAERVEHL